MFWIVGGGAILPAWAASNEWSWLDVAGWRRGAVFFEVLGANAVLIYVLQAFVDFEALARVLLDMRGALKLHPALTASGALALQWALLYALYRKRWFLRF